MTRDFTPEEVAEVNRRAHEFLEGYKAQPMAEKRATTNPRLDGQVDFRVVPTSDESAAEGDERSAD